MPRDYDDDRDDRDDRDDDRPRRRRAYDDNAPPPKKSGGAGMVLLIVGLAVGLPLLICGGVCVYIFVIVKQGVETIADAAQSQTAASNFLAALGRNDVNGAYNAYTTANFRTKVPREQFDKLVKDNPALTRAHLASPSAILPKPTGTAPNRTVTLTYTVSATATYEEPDDPPSTKPAATKPKPGGGKMPPVPGIPAPPAPPVTCTLTLAEQPDGTWKVDGFTVP